MVWLLVRTCSTGSADALQGTPIIPACGSALLRQSNPRVKTVNGNHTISFLNTESLTPKLGVHKV